MIFLNVKYNDYLKLEFQFLPQEFRKGTKLVIFMEN